MRHVRRPFDAAAFAAERSPGCRYHMIAAADGTIGGTMTHTLESSHSPFLSQPAALSKILIDIGVQCLAKPSAEAP
jgi:hypothetical protein